MFLGFDVGALCFSDDCQFLGAFLMDHRNPDLQCHNHTAYYDPILSSINVIFLFCQ